MALRFKQMNGNNGGFLGFFLDSRKLLSLMLLGLSAIVLWGLNAVKNELEVNISSELQTRLQSTRANLTLWTQEKSSQINNWANNPNVRANVLSLAESAAFREINPSVLLKSRELAELRRILGPVCTSHNYVGFVLFDRTGLQIASLLDKPVGQRQLIELSDFVKRSMEGETVVSLPFIAETSLPTIHAQWKKQWPTMFVSAPVRDYSGEVVAVLAFRLRPEIEFSRITEIGRTGESGETYAFDANGLLLSNSRFENQLRDMGVLSEDSDQMSMLNVRLIERGKHFNKRNPRLTLAVQSAIKGESGMDIRGYPDYRGVKVIGGWTWLEKYNLGLVTEIDLKEAFAPLLIMERVFIAFFVLLLGAVGTFRFLSERELKLEKEREKVSGLLKDSEKKASLILNAAGDGIYGIDTKGVVTFINPSAARMLGYSPQELIGKPQHSLIHHTHLDGTPYSQEECPIYAVFKDGQVHSVNDEVFWRKDGTSFLVEYVSTPIYEDGKLNGAVVTFKDITERKQVEDLVNRMGRILEDSFNEIYLFDAQNFKYIQVNRGACENLGYTQEELHQMNAFDILPKFGQQRFKKLVKLLLLGSAHRTVFETEQKRKDGSSYPVEVRLQLTTIDNSTLFLAIVQDITERKRAELARLQAQNQLEERVQQRTVELKTVNEAMVEEIAEKKQAQEALERMMRQNELILKSVGDGLFGFNLEGEIIFYNPSALQMLRFKNEELAGKSLHQVLNLLHENDPQKNSDYPLYQVFKDGQTQSKDEEVFWRKDGSALLAEYICAPIYEDERIVGAVVTFRDILRRKRAEDALVQAKELAERANQAKSDFLSRMSHELRTPLNSILGFAQILEMDTLDPLTGRQQPWVGQIRKAGGHLLELINDILDLARIESGKMTISLENVDVVDLLREVLILILPMTQERNIKIVNRIPVPSLLVFADRIRLKQVLLNLLSNAVKYNIENGLICIYYRIGEGGRIGISIEDSGIGFSEDKIAELFEPFSRLDADSGVQGTGIGLTITRRLIEQMQGDIFVESVPGKGSCFTLELPPGRDPEQNPISDDSGLEAEPNSINPDKSYTLLYIEDSPDNLILIRRVLKTHKNIHLITSMEGKAGIELALAHCPDLILMDINLPGMDGFTALKALRANQETQSIPVVAVSANAMGEDVEIGMNAGFDAYLTKPINVTRLMEVIGRLLETNRGASLKVSRR